MKKQSFIWAGAIAVCLIIIYIGYRLISPIWGGIQPALFADKDTAKSVVSRLSQADESHQDNGPFTVHSDFLLTVFSDQVDNPRVMIEGEEGEILVSQPARGIVGILDENGDHEVLVDNLRRPHGLALKNNKLFVAETGQVIQYSYTNRQAADPVVLMDLPVDGRHWTRTLGIGPDGHLYISIGSSCNICVEDDWRRDKILRYDLETEELITYASGLRNAVFFEWNSDGELFATEMGRDWLGDDLPPDELNLIEEGRDYGFPYCYGKSIVDPEFDNSTICEQAEPSYYDFQAHVSPLGIDFFNDDAIIALHGSWNRTEPVGYKVIRLSSESGFQEEETILSGFLLDDGSSIGRPAGVLVTNDQKILISDDASDVIYQLIPRS